MQKNIKKFILETIGTIVGAFIMSVSISFFLLPNELSSGGFSGIATAFYYILKIPMGVTIAVLNIPMFIFSSFKIGKDFFVKSLIGTASLSIFIDLLDKFPAITNDKLLAAIYGGVLTGIGMAIILKSNSSTGGSDLLTILVKSFNDKIQMSKFLVLLDGAIVLFNVILLKNIEIGLYSAITIYLLGFMIDIIFEGIFFSKLIFIISDKNDLIAKQIETKINRGITGLYAKGMYKGNDKMVLMCAVNRNDIANIKKLILSIDKNAFIIITNSREVLGIGFKE